MVFLGGVDFGFALVWLAEWMGFFSFLYLLAYVLYRL